MNLSQLIQLFTRLQTVSNDDNNNKWDQANDLAQSLLAQGLSGTFLNDPATQLQALVEQLEAGQ